MVVEKKERKTQLTLSDFELEDLKRGSALVHRLEGDWHLVINVRKNDEILNPLRDSKVLG